MSDIKGILKGVSYTLAITADHDTITFLDDMTSRGRESTDELLRPPAMIDFDNNTITWLNPTIEDAAELINWVKDSVELANDPRYGVSTIKAFFTARYEHIEFGQGVCDCTVCQEGYLTPEYFN